VDFYDSLARYRFCITQACGWFRRKYQTEAYLIISCAEFASNPTVDPRLDGKTEGLEDADMRSQSVYPIFSFRSVMLNADLM
jgi:hypothetical protein